MVGASHINVSSPHAPSDPRVRGRRAMLLAEVIIAVVLLAASLAVVLAMAGRSLSAQRTGEELQIAAMLLDEQLNLVLARGPDNYAATFPTEGPCDAPYSNYAFALSFSGGTAGEPYTVTATVSWLHNGKPMSESVQTFIAPRLGDEPDPDRRPGAPVERSNL